MPEQTNKQKKQDMPKTNTQDPNFGTLKVLLRFKI